MFRKLSPAQLVIDIVVACLILLASLPFLSFSGYSSLSGIASPWELLGGLLTAIILSGAAALRRLSPPLALAIAWLGAIVQMAFLRAPGIEDIAILMVLFATSAYGSRRTMWWGLASTGAGSLVAAAYSVFVFAAPGESFTPPTASDPGWISLVIVSVLFLVATIATMGLSWSAGLIVRLRLRSRRVEQERAIAEALASAEAERAQIARDMHDVVAHSLAVVIAQADGARYAAAADPHAATEALRTIATTSRSALTDVRLLLTQLRHSQTQGPQPTIADLEGLYAQVQAAGLELRITVDPVPRADPPGAVQLAVYRILQEALTNAMRHGGGAVVEVYLAWQTDRVDLGVHNDIDSTEKPTSGGHGLIGMRERAQLVGGRLDAGQEGSRFVVRASIPIAIQQEE